MRNVTFLMSHLSFILTIVEEEFLCQKEQVVACVVQVAVVCTAAAAVAGSRAVHIPAAVHLAALVKAAVCLAEEDQAAA